MGAHILFSSTHLLSLDNTHDYNNHHNLLVLVLVLHRPPTHSTATTCPKTMLGTHWMVAYFHFPLTPHPLPGSSDAEARRTARDC